MIQRIAIIYPNKSSSSETFIKAHVDHLPCEKKILYGGWFPHFTEGDRLLAAESSGFLFNLKKRILNHLFKESRNVRKELSMKRALLRYITNNNIQAVLAEYGPTGVAVMDVCHQANVPLIVHFHGFDAYLTETITKYKAQYIELFDKAKAIIAVSKDMKDQLVSLGASPLKVHYNPYGVDVNKFSSNALAVKEPVFFFIGRFVNKKAPHLLILAFSKVQKIIPKAKLIMGGDEGGGPDLLYSACKQLVRAMNLSHCVEFRGAMTPNEVAQQMQNAYAYVQHSVRPDSGDSEGTPNSILEAAATGLPVVATKHAGIKDVIMNGETGYLVDEYDVDGMAEKMIELVNNPTLAYKMGEVSRRNILNNFTMEKAISRLWDIIKNTTS